MLWRDMRGSTMEEIHKELQDLNPTGFPHLEEILIRSRSPIFFPKKDARNMED
jgi:hypothetical protein